MSLRLRKSNWLDFVSIKVDTIKEKLRGIDIRLIKLKNYESIAEKIHRHSRHCQKCRDLKEIFADNLEDIEKIVLEGRIKEENSFVRRKYYYPIAHHLYDDHDYKPPGKNRIRFTLLSIQINIILASINSFIPFGWHWFFALIQLPIFWFIGYVRDKKNLRKGIRLDSFHPAPENWGEDD